MTQPAADLPASAVATTPTPTAPAIAAAAAPTKSRYDRSIIEGPLMPAVWKLAWPTMLTNIFGGLQGIIDNILVGHLVGYEGNAGIGVANQIWIVIIVFIMSVFTGMSVLVARFVGAGNEEMADRTVYQAFLTAMAISLGVLAPIGYFAAPYLLRIVNAAPAVQAQALPFLRICLLFSAGMLVFFMLSGALRSAGDARTPMVMGIALTIMNIAFNIVLIRGLGPIPAFGTKGAAMGTALASCILAVYALWKLWSGGWVVSFPRKHGFAPDWEIIKSLFRFGLPTGL
ncbi:MAG TPA: MATE family efflux transporter, partial [Gemmatimonadaceae bacterium]|nr:MATE family efflux transporter [Gemmatimonadaceae bacterium]